MRPYARIIIERNRRLADTVLGSAGRINMGIASMMKFPAISILIITFVVACGDNQTTDSYSYLFNCDELMGKLQQKYPDSMSNKEYRIARQVECEAARGKISDTHPNIVYARYYVADFYVSFGELTRAAQMYKASVAALSIGDKWKYDKFCSLAAMAAGKLASLEIQAFVISQDDRARYAKHAAYWGNQNGTYFYARHLEQGQGVLRDLVSAYAWYNVTAAYADGLRSKVAEEALARLDSELPIQARLEAQSLSRTLQAEIKARQDCKYMVD